MADIKFMDISENDNPATTDSILVGNADNGVKRTTLGKLGDMFAVHGLLHIERVDSIVQANTLNYPIVAKPVEGYTFAFWATSLSSYWIAPTYIEDPTIPSTTIWVAFPDGSNLQVTANGNTKVSAIAVYVKNSVA